MVGTALKYGRTRSREKKQIGCGDNPNASPPRGFQDSAVTWNERIAVRDSCTLMFERPTVIVRIPYLCRPPRATMSVYYLPDPLDPDSNWSYQLGSQRTESRSGPQKLFTDLHHFTP